MLKRTTVTTLSVIVMILVNVVGWTVAADEAPATNLVAGKSYIIEGVSPHNNYREADPPKLTDGRRAPSDVSVSPGDPYVLGLFRGGARGVEATITFDLGAAETVDQIRVSAYGHFFTPIYYPDEVRVEVSYDGLTWDEIGVLGPPISRTDVVETKVAGSMWYEFPVSDGQGEIRHVKVTAKISRVSWLMLDEIEVLQIGE